MNSSLVVNEIFTSIQGEGRNIGKPRLFIRLHGCNMSCAWCDSKSTWDGHEEGTPPLVMSVEDMAALIEEKGYPVVWTGGEPALQESQIQKVRDLVDWNIGFEMETNGSVMLEDPEYFDLIVVSPKIDAGNVIDIISKYSRINAQYGNIIFKLAVMNPAVVKDIIDSSSVDPDIIYAMPITFEGMDVLTVQKEFAQECLELHVNFSPRLHKLFNIP